MLQELLAGPAGPFVVFALRLCDVSLATLRMLMIVRGRRAIAPLIGFVEVMIWVVAIGAVVQHLDSPFHIVGYASGFAAGTFLGLLIEERMALGLATIRTVVRTGGPALAASLRDEGFGVTEMVGKGRQGPVEVLYSVIPRRGVDRCLEIIDEGAPDSFVVVDEPRSVQRGWLLSRRRK